MKPGRKLLESGRKIKWENHFIGRNKREIVHIETNEIYKIYTNVAIVKTNNPRIKLGLHKFRIMKVWIEEENKWIDYPSYNGRTDIEILPNEI